MKLAKNTVSVTLNLIRCTTLGFEMAMNPKFKDDHLVIITAKEKVTMPNWGDFILKEWDRLMKENTKLLVLAGVHGDEDGKVGSDDKRFISHSEKQKGRFMRTEVSKL